MVKHRKTGKNFDVAIPVALGIDGEEDKQIESWMT